MGHTLTKVKQCAPSFGPGSIVHMMMFYSLRHSVTKYSFELVDQIGMVTLVDLKCSNVSHLLHLVFDQKLSHISLYANKEIYQHFFTCICIFVTTCLYTLAFSDSYLRNMPLLKKTSLFIFCDWFHISTFVKWCDFYYLYL